MLIRPKSTGVPEVASDLSDRKYEIIYMKAGEGRGGVVFSIVHFLDMVYAGNEQIPVWRQGPCCD
jgi:hypothetical protein